MWIILRIVSIVKILIVLIGLISLFYVDIVEAILSDSLGAFVRDGYKVLMVYTFPLHLDNNGKT